MKKIGIVLLALAVVIGTVCLLGVGRKNGWSQTDEGWQFYADGSQIKGWLTDNGMQYYTDPETGIMQTGWKQLPADGDKPAGWYYFAKSGEMAKGWKALGGWYYFQDSGVMHTGWLEEKDAAGKATWYHLTPNGAMAVGWYKINDGQATNWHFFTKSGAMKTGWHSEGNSWYFLKGDGKMAVGWLTIAGKNYHFTNTGKMAANTTIDGRKVGASGAEVLPATSESEGEGNGGSNNDANNGNSQQPATGSLAGKIIGIDPGHQGKGNSAKEPQAPGSSIMKAKVTSGTRGVYSKVYEHVINLQAGLQLRDKLEAEGATVVMTRTSADVDISNSERAKLLNNAGCHLAIRLHADGAESSSANGVSVLIPSGQYTKNIQAESRKAGQLVLEEYVKATGARNRGISERDDQTGFNWSTVPVINIEMGFMSNKEEDIKLNDANYRDKAMNGVVKGVKRYFGVL